MVEIAYAPALDGISLDESNTRSVEGPYDKSDRELLRLPTN